MYECPVCFEELSNITCIVTTACCNNSIHLECMHKCKYKCPLCRHQIIVDITDENPLLEHPIPVDGDLCSARVMRVLTIICVILGVSYYSILLAGSVSQSAVTPPPPPDGHMVPPYPGFG